MAFTLNFSRSAITDRVDIHCYDDEEGDHTLAAGEWIQVRIGTPEEPVVLLQEQVPVGKVWTAIHFQFQALEDPVA
jgi:hypothetical protein